MGKIVRLQRTRQRGRARRLSRGERRLSALAALVVAGGVTSLVADRIDPSIERSLSNGLQSVGNLLPESSGSTLTGKASVIDGDTIEIHDRHIRFDGIDAPEATQLCKDGRNMNYRCGQDAALFLEKFIAVASPVRCEFVTFDQYDRFVGDCYRADGASLNAAMVRSGYALDWPKHSKGKYAAYQRKAKAEKSGMWAGSFQPTWEFRAEQQLKAPQTPGTPESIAPSFAIGKPVAARPSKGVCNIKGNVSIETGERIYHVPGQRFYSKTRISPEKGEKWFCSEEEAVAAGWRRSRQ